MVQKQIQSKPNIIPPYHSRSILVGKTGSGKSTLAKEIIKQYPNDSVIILDPKCSRSLSEYTNTDDLADVNTLAKNNNIVVYRPAVDVQGITHWDNILKWIYLREHTILVIDELYGLSDNGYTYPTYLKGIYTRGRERGITVIGQSQRPRGIPRYCKTECEGCYVFEMALDDRKDLAAEFGNELLILPDEYAFWYIQDRSKPIQLRLKIK